jgi:hypothetical protein
MKKYRTHQEYLDSIEPFVSSFDKFKMDLLQNLLVRFEKLEQSLCILVQGPLNNRMLESVPIYLSYIKSLDNDLSSVVISCWEGDDMSVIKELKPENEPFLDVIVNKKSECPSNIARLTKHGASPWIFQNYTSQEGSNKSKAYFLIKTRSDEIYPSINLFHEKILKNPYKITTSDIFFRNDSRAKFHISDHLIGGRTNVLKEAFSNAVKICNSKHATSFSFPEQLICKAILNARGVYNIKDYKSKKIMQDNFEIMPIKKMPGTIWTCSYRKYAKLTQPELDWVQDIKNI